MAPGEEDPWPWTKFRRGLADGFPDGQRKEERQMPAAIVVTGAFSPAHLSHVRMLWHAKERLQKAGYAVCGAWLSPCHEQAAGVKARQRRGPELSAAFRLRVAELCAGEDSFVSVARWELERGDPPDYVAVVRELQRRLDRGFKAAVGGQRWTVFLVCGSDEKKLHRRLLPANFQGHVIVPRNGEGLILEKPGDHLFVAKPAPGRGCRLSSGKLLTALKNGDTAYVATSMPAAAARLLLSPTEAERRELAADFRALEQGAAHSYWPSETFARRLLDLPPDSIPAVLVVSVAEGPAHRGHLRMLHQARARLEAAGYAVLAAWLSPCCAARARREAEAEGLPLLQDAFRLKLAELVACSDEFVSVGSWELSVEGHEPRPRELVASLHNHLERRFHASLEGLQLKTLLACPAAAAARQRLDHGFPGQFELGVVLLPGADDVFLEMPHQMLFIADPLPGDLAAPSPRLLAAVGAGDHEAVAGTLGAAAARFLLAPTAQERRAFAGDFTALGTRAPEARELAEAREGLKAALKAWSPTGSIASEDLGRLLKALDPSWTSKELGALLAGCAGSAGGGAVVSDDFVDWIFSCCQPPQAA